MKKSMMQCILFSDVCSLTNTKSNLEGKFSLNHGEGEKFDER